MDSIKPVLKLFWQYARRYKFTLFITLFFSFVVSVLKIVVPFYYKKIFDVLAGDMSVSIDHKAQVLIGILGSIVLLQGVDWISRRINQWFYIYFQADLMTDLVRFCYEYLSYHSFGFFSNNFTGSLVRKVGRMPQAFERVMDEVKFTHISFIVIISGILFVLFSRHILLGFIFLIWLIIFILAQFGVIYWKRKYDLALAKKDSEVTGALSDGITNNTTVKLFSGEDYEKSIFKKVTGEQRALYLRVWGIDEWVSTIQGFLAICVEIGLMYAAIRLWQRGLVTVGDFALIQAYIIQALDNVWGLGHSMRRTYEAFADAQEMVDILEEPHGVIDKPKARKLKVINGEIEFNNVSFSFQQTRNILKHFNLSIQSGEKVGLVGPSGAGKSTITKLLLRFYDVEDGEILIDGMNIANVTQQSLRDNIALVPQEPILFHRTLWENIAYGKRDASEEEIIEAAKKAHCHEFIASLPEGYDTYVGERGIKLSGGERQRVAIARAILKNAPILVLDEATSSLDSKSEALIQDALEQLMRGKTVIVIAHRLSTIMKMDRIVVIENGSVTAEGTHENLLSQTGSVYKKLWEIQAGGFLEA